MIARVWAARATSALAPAYAEHLRAHVLPELRRVDGFVGAELWQRADGEAAAGDVEIVVVTRWRSLDAIHGFAGADIETAVVADEAAALLTSYDDRVRHYEVADADHP